MGRLSASPSTVRPTPKIIIMAKEFPMIRSASSTFPRPLSMEQRGAPPMPNKLAKAITMEMMGRQRPTPVRGRLPEPGILPIYIRSTTL